MKCARCKTNERDGPHPSYCRECVRWYNQRNMRRYRRMAFEAYGGARCVWCGEDDFDVLSLDHINNDGAEHRKLIQTQPGSRGPGGHRLYHWLRKNGYPKGFQVLCQNCNVAKHKNGGILPGHRKADWYSPLDLCAC